jgi:predicted dehydrogenase
MTRRVGRRSFLQHASALGAALSAGLAVAQEATPPVAPNRIVVGIMGLGRGRGLTETFAAQENVEIRYLCDVDQQRIDSCREALRDRIPADVKTVRDFRQMLDDPDVDALVCAAPNHWHAPATILACQANKHVYVEKPCSHNPWEGELMVRAARQHKRVVQLGTQRRSNDGTRQAIQQLADGAIGRVYLARCWYNNVRGPIGRGRTTPVPGNLDYDLWQGPAPRREYRDNVVHYNWHWRWHWGNGELGNNGVHAIDICRFGLAVDFPSHVTSSGGRYVYDDDQETPDTHTVCFEFEGNQQITWQGLSCNPHGDGFVTFYGTDGTLALAANGSFQIFGRDDRVRFERKEGDPSDEARHVANFLAAIRQDDPQMLHAEIAEGHKSTLLCHLGNIAHRTARALKCAPVNGHVLDDAEAMSYWRREYAEGWEPRV